MTGALALVVAAQGQSWQQQLVPTNADLWGIAEGYVPSSPFPVPAGVAVGTAGTILSTGTSSYDGHTAWTQETSGTSNWLVAVTFATPLQLWVAVGDNGTILTSTDTVTWTAQNSGTTQRLNGIAFTDAAGTGAPSLLAVGENGTVCSSPDGVHWTAANAGVSGWLRGVIPYGEGPAANIGYLISGEGGTLLFTHDGQTFTPASSGTTEDLECLASISDEDSGVLACGSGGWIGTYSDPGVALPQLTAQTSTGVYLRGISEFVSSSATLGWPSVQVAVGDGGASFINGALVQLPTTANLNAVVSTGGGGFYAVGDGGSLYNYSVFVTSSQPGVTASTAWPFIGDTDVLQAPAAAGATYQWYFNGQPLAGATSASLTLPNLQPSQAGSYVVSVATNSSMAFDSHEVSVAPFRGFSPNLVDGTFSPPLLPDSEYGFSILLPLANGKVMVQTSGGTLQRLNADGSLDSTFTTSVAATGALLAQPDGKLVVLNSNPPVRLNTDGTLDATFVPDPVLGTAASVVLEPNGDFWAITTTPTQLAWTQLSSTGAATGVTGSVTLPPQAQTYVGVDNPSAFGVVAAVDNGGNLWIGANAPTYYLSLAAGTSPAASYIYAVDPNGDLVGGFAQGSELGAFGVLQLTPYGAGMYYIGQGSNDMPSAVIGRLTAAGGPDPAWPQRTYRSGPAAAVDANGNVILLTAQATSIGTEEDLTEIGPDDTQNENFGGTLYVQQTYGSLPTGILSLTPDGKLLLPASAVNGASVNGLVRIVPDQDYAATRLTNLSILGQTGLAGAPLTLGFVVGGSGNSDVLLRASGPALAQFGVSDTVADPAITLYQGNTPMTANDNWSAGANAGSISAAAAAVGAFAFPPGSLDAALLSTLPAGDYSLQASAHGATGTTLAELYGTDAAPTEASQARLLNVSVLTQIPSPGQSATVGFVIAGPNARRLLIRAIGPGLSSFGVSSPLADPTLTVYSGTQAFVTGNSASSYSLQSILSAAGQSVGAFAMTNADAAVLVTLPAGPYTVQGSGGDSSTGALLIEVYELP